MRRLAAIVSTIVLTTGLSVSSAGPASAAGEVFKTLSIEDTGCSSGNFRLLMDRTNWDGGIYSVRTLVTVDGRVYTNEHATASGTGPTSWGLFDNFSYGPVPNQGTWPIPADTQMRIDFTLERPQGTVIYAWTTVVDGCNSGNILYNDLTSKDVDHDLIKSGTDKCPSVFSETDNGCPEFDRKITLKYVAGPGTFKGKLKAPGATALRQGQKVSIWKVKPGNDKRIGKVKTKANGAFKLKNLGEPGKYYATAKAVREPATGQSDAVKSAKLKLG